MQIGSTELIIILIIFMVVYGFYKAKPSSPTNSAASRERQQAKDGQAHDEDAEAEQSESAQAKKAPPRASSAKDPYAVLNISTNATQDEVTTAYRKMAQMYHPDKVAGLAPEYREIAEKKMKDINAAYEQLQHKFKAKG
jgi:preprotein translocase subunit Sec63